LSMIISGVEFGEECFCGKVANLKLGQKLEPGLCDTYPCPANSSVACGGFNAVAAYHTGYKDPPKIKLKTNELLLNKKPAKIAFLLQLNGRAVRQVVRLLRLIYRPEHIYLVHVDSVRVYLQVFNFQRAARQNYMYREMRSLQKSISAAANFHVLTRRFATIWGGASLLKMFLSSADQLLQLSSDWGFKSPMITTTTTMTIANNVTCNITNANTTTTIIGNTANTSATLSTCFRFPELKSSDLIDITEETTTVTCAAVSRPAIPPRNSSLAQSPKAITLPHPLRFISTLPVNTTTTTNTNTTTTTSLDESRYENREQLVSSTIVTRNKNKNIIKNIHIHNHNHNHNNNVKNVLVQPIAKVTPEPSSSSSMKREQVMEIITVGNSVKFPPPIPPKSSTKGGSGGGGGGGGGDTSTTPPPRPPKRVPVEKSDHAPPLPPKTYKQKQWPSKKMGNHFPK
ncbi:Xylosyltransferase sqv-6, partial [Trichinella pseudospiralis]